MNPTETWLQELSSVYDRHRDNIRAAGGIKYLRNQFGAFGLSNGGRRSLAKPFLKSGGKYTAAEIIELITALWDLPEREFQHTAMELAYHSREKLGHDLPGIIAFMVSHKSWWDTVDYIAAHLAGWAYSNGYLTERDIRKWNTSGELWLIRTSILFQLRYKRETDWPLLKAMILPHTGHPDFFIRKAIGWALREYSKSDPARVRIFAESHPLSALSKKEALRLL